MAQLANSHLLKKMSELAQHKAGSKDDQRGLDLWGEVDQEGYAVESLTIILECLQHWAELYPADVTGKNTPFKEHYTKLLNYNVYFPKQYDYIIKPVLKKEQQHDIMVSAVLPMNTSAVI